MVETSLMRRLSPQNGATSAKHGVDGFEEDFAYSAIPQFLKTSWSEPGEFRVVR